MTHQPSDPTQPPVPLPFSLTRSLSDCHFTSKGMFVMKALYLLVGLAYGSKRLPLFWCFSPSSSHSEQVVLLHWIQKRRKKHSQVSTTQKTIFDFPGKLSWLSQAKLHITQEYWVTQTEVVHRAENCSSTLLKIHLSKKPFPRQMCFPRPSHTPVGL